jgi:hypothetical protein
MVQAAITNWKTSVAGVVLGASVLVALNAYKPGMSLKQWVGSALLAILAAMPGILAHDGQATPPAAAATK